MTLQMIKFLQYYTIIFQRDFNILEWNNGTQMKNTNESD